VYINSLKVYTCNLIKNYQAVMSIGLDITRVDCTLHLSYSRKTSNDKDPKSARKSINKIPSGYVYSTYLPKTVLVACKQVLKILYIYSKPPTPNAWMVKLGAKQKEFEIILEDRIWEWVGEYKARTRIIHCSNRWLGAKLL